jgi:hypothetical protein
MPLLLLADAQRDHDELVDELLAHHELACQLRAHLDATPRWRWLRRSNIDRVLREVCLQADLIRDLLGATGSGEGMYALLERTATRNHGGKDQ